MPRARVAIVGPSYNLTSRPGSVQRTVNMFPVPIEPGNERSPWALKDVPGLVEFGVTRPTIGLLDPWPTALWGAYGRVLMRGNYTGPAMRVRKGLGGPQQDFYPPVDTAALAAFLDGSVGYVAVWYDQSGGGHHLYESGDTQATVTVTADGSVKIAGGTASILETTAQSTAGIDSLSVLYVQRNVVQPGAMVSMGGAPTSNGAILNYNTSNATADVIESYIISDAVMTQSRWTYARLTNEATTRYTFGVRWLRDDGALSSQMMLDAAAQTAHTAVGDPTPTFNAGKWRLGFSSASAAGNTVEAFAVWERLLTTPEMQGASQAAMAGGVMAQVRGLYTFNGVLHSVIGDELARIDSAGAMTPLSRIGSSAGPVEMVQNVSQLVIGDGAQMYVWNGSSLQTVSRYPLGDSLAFVDQRVVFLERGTQRFRWTALGDAATVDALDFKSAEGSPDKLVAVVSNLRELLMLGEFTGEVWLSTGGTFARSESEFIQYGCSAARSARLVGDTPVWLGRSEEGGPQVLAGRGKRVSTRAVEERFEGLDVGEARAFTYGDGTSQFYCLNVPTLDTTLCFDLTFGEWHERAELVNGQYAQWRPTCHAYAYGRHFVGDADGRIYTLDPKVHNYAGAVKCRDRISPVLSVPGSDRLNFGTLDLVCERGTGGAIMMRTSDDDGATWSKWRTQGTTSGKHRSLVGFNRNGSATDKVFHLRMTDDAPFNPVSAAVDVGGA